MSAIALVNNLLFSSLLVAHVLSRRWLNMWKHLVQGAIARATGRVDSPVALGGVKEQPLAQSFP